MRRFLLVISIFTLSHSWAQDTSFQVANQSFTLADVIVRNNFDYKAILEKIKRDFCRSFRHCRAERFC